MCEIVCECLHVSVRVCVCVGESLESLYFSSNTQIPLGRLNSEVPWVGPAQGPVLLYKMRSKPIRACSFTHHSESFIVHFLESAHTLQFICRLKHPCSERHLCNTVFRHLFTDYMVVEKL